MSNSSSSSAQDCAMEPEVVIRERGRRSAESYKQKRHRYDLHTKYQLLKDMDNGLKYKELQAKYGLANSSSISGK